MPMSRLLLSVVFAGLVWCAEPIACQPSPELQVEFQEAGAISAAVADPFGALDKAAPFLAVRDRHPDSLFAHERYQDAIYENGIEGHLRLLTKQYDDLEVKHPGDPMYRYLSLRTLVGRSTLRAIQGLNELLASRPDFAPAHRTLAEIYGVAAFRDPDKEKSEREQFQAACPDGVFTRRPASIPGPSPLIDRAERMLAQDGDPDAIVAMTIQGLKEFEWRSQRIRAFDWYTMDYKRQDARELRTKYWQAWPIQVRAYRKGGMPDMANQLLAVMEQRAKRLLGEPGSAYEDAQAVLARLHAEGDGSEGKPALRSPRAGLDSPPLHLAGLPWSRHKATNSETFASPTHMTVSAPPQ
jgi:hypothetical protein